MLIHTPRLCGEPVFLEGRRTDASTAAAIECQPVVRELPKEGELAEPAAPAAGHDSASGSTVTPQGNDGAQLYLEGAGERLPQQAGEQEQHNYDLPEHSNLDAELDHNQYHDDQEVFYDEEETMLTLVYDPETGEIESAVTESGEDVFLDSALRKLLFGGGDEHDEHVTAGADAPEQANIEVGGDLANLRQIVNPFSPERSLVERTELTWLLNRSTTRSRMLCVTTRTASRPRGRRTRSRDKRNSPLASRRCSTSRSTMSFKRSSPPYEAPKELPRPCKHSKRSPINLQRTRGRTCNPACTSTCSSLTGRGRPCRSRRRLFSGTTSTSR